MKHTEIFPTMKPVDWYLMMTQDTCRYFGLSLYLNPEVSRFFCGILLIKNCFKTAFTANAFWACLFIRQNPGLNGSGFFFDVWSSAGEVYAKQFRFGGIRDVLALKSLCCKSRILRHILLIVFSFSIQQDILIMPTVIRRSICFRWLTGHLHH